MFLMNDRKYIDNHCYNNQSLPSLFLTVICLNQEAKVVASDYPTTNGWIIVALYNNYRFLFIKINQFFPIFGGFGGHLGFNFFKWSP